MGGCNPRAGNMNPITKEQTELSLINVDLQLLHNRTLLFRLRKCPRYWQTPSRKRGQGQDNVRGRSGASFNLLIIEIETSSTVCHTYSCTTARFT